MNPCPVKASSYACQRADSIEAKPEIDFIVIINPNSGPGAPPLPDASYEREIALLNGQSNVKTLGYVRTDYCKRPIDEVYSDIAVYAGWSSHEGVGVKGIFFDETPNNFSKQSHTYLTKVTAEVRNTSGIEEPRLVRSSLQLLQQCIDAALL